jgi:hypothetical protein
MESMLPHVWLKELNLQTLGTLGQVFLTEDIWTGIKKIIIVFLLLPVPNAPKSKK